MNINKYLMLGGVALGLGLTSCVGDLDLEPIDPNLESPESSTILINEAMQCYQTMATSGQEGPGSSIISGLDNGRGQYTRAIFMMNEFPTDECIWIWKDDGIYDLVTNTFDATNGNIYGTYSRLYAHIAVCNQFLADAAGSNDAEIVRLRDEVRALRAMSYYWVCDIFGKASKSMSAPDGTEPEQMTREELYTWLEAELKDLVDNGNLADVPVYGRVGKDGAQALLARLYLNAEVYSGTPASVPPSVRKSSHAIRVAAMTTRVSPKTISISSAATTRSICPAAATLPKTRFCGVCLSTASACRAMAAQCS